MLQFVKMQMASGETAKVFLSDTDYGQSLKDVLTVPGVYESILDRNPDLSLKLKKMNGTIGSYRTACFALEMAGNVEEDDCTVAVAQLLVMPETAAKAFMSSYTVELRETCEQALLDLHFCEKLTEDSRLCLPPVAFDQLPTDLQSKMASVRKIYALKNTENQEIFQTSFDANYGVLLPQLDEIHNGTADLVSALDVLRVIAPYRKQERPGTYSYKGIYHTPYYRVDMRLRGMVPSHLSWIDGYSVNDTLDIQANEQHMANNLRALICSDISRYVSEMVSGIFFDSPLGSLLLKLCDCKDEEVLHQLFEDIKERSTQDASCSISLNEITEVSESGWYAADVTRIIKQNLRYTNEFLVELVSRRPVDRRIVECDNLPFVLDLSDDQEQELTELLISLGYISSAMQKFLIDLCKKAYRVNWGHTGATLAIPGFVVQNAIGELDGVIGEYIGESIGKTVQDLSKYEALYLKVSSNMSDDEGFEDNDAEEIFSRFDYYVTADTAQKMATDSLGYDYFSTSASAAQTTEAAIVEYWRNVNGENNLDNFISTSFLKTADISILTECFVKLMRWGERKPKLLVLQHHPEIRHVFDLSSGLRVDNTAIVDESELVKVNGCDYSLVAPLYSDTNPTIQSDQIVGFVLEKDYGSVKKSFLASWLDIGEMIVSGNINIGNFVSVSKVSFVEVPRVTVESYSKQEHSMYVSDENIKQGLSLKVQPKDLNALTLLTTPGITNSVEYLRSLKNDTIITTKDRQYDILRRYVKVLQQFYVKHGEIVKRVSNTVGLGELAETFYRMFTGEGMKEEANAGTARSTLKALNLDGVDTSAIKWDDTELVGKFYLISDVDMKSTLSPIEFTDPGLRNFAQRPDIKNRLVMLMMKQNGKCIFCRKDIKVGEVLVLRGTKPDGTPTKKVGHRTYAVLAQVISRLEQGQDVVIDGETYVLHRSLSEFF